MRRKAYFLIGLLLMVASRQTFSQKDRPIVVSYEPSVGRIIPYRILITGEVLLSTPDGKGFSHFSAEVKIGQRWRRAGHKLATTLTIKGGTLRVFSPLGERRWKLGRTELTLMTTPFGEVLSVQGGGGRSLEELTANMDLLATALATLVVPFPEGGVKVGTAWQAHHRFETSVGVATIHCLEANPPTPLRPPTLRLQLRYTLPMDFFIPPSLRPMMDFTARYTADSEVLFDLIEGHTLSASGTIQLVVKSRISLPRNRSGGVETSRTSGENPHTLEGNRESTLSPLSFSLVVEAKFHLVRKR